MAKVSRNGPCTCGSGTKAKRCCHGPITYVDVRIMPLDMIDVALSVLRSTSEIELRAHFDKLIYLSLIHISSPGRSHTVHNLPVGASSVQAAFNAQHSACLLYTSRCV